MSVKNLHAEKASAKIKEMAESIDFCMLCTDLSSKPFHAIPMSTKRVDEDGKVWFLSGKDSQHNENILRDSQVELLYSSPSSMQFLSIFGSATIHTDRETLEKLYGNSDDAWFEGLDDPNLTALAIEPTDTHYWDPKNGKLVSLMKMGVAAVTGDEPDLMDQGKISV